MKRKNSDEDIKLTKIQKEAGATDLVNKLKELNDKKDNTEACLLLMYNLEEKDFINYITESSERLKEFLLPYHFCPGSNNYIGLLLSQVDNVEILNAFQQELEKLSVKYKSPLAILINNLEKKEFINYFSENEEKMSDFLQSHNFYLDSDYLNNLFLMQISNIEILSFFKKALKDSLEESKTHNRSKLKNIHSLQGNAKKTVDFEKNKISKNTFFSINKAEKIYSLIVDSFQKELEGCLNNRKEIMLENVVNRMLALLLIDKEKLQKEKELIDDNDEKIDIFDTGLQQKIKQDELLMNVKEQILKLLLVRKSYITDVEIMQELAQKLKKILNEEENFKKSCDLLAANIKNEKFIEHITEHLEEFLLPCHPDAGNTHYARFFLKQIKNIDTLEKFAKNLKKTNKMGDLYNNVCSRINKLSEHTSFSVKRWSPDIFKTPGNSTGNSVYLKSNILNYTQYT